MAEVLAELVAKITADATGLKKGLAESEKDIKGLGKTTEKETRSIKDTIKGISTAWAGVGVAIVGSITMIVKSFTQMGSELHDLSLKTGVSVEALAGLKYAAEQNGASLGTVEMAIRRTASALTDAKDGLTEANRAFDKMGISIKDLEGLNVEEQFLKIAGGIASIPDPMTRASVAVDLFGRSGTDMLPMLSEGAEGLKRYMAEGQKVYGITTQNAKMADAFGDALGNLKAATQGVSNSIGAILAPVLKDTIDKFIGITKTIKEWIQINPELVKAIAAGALAVGGIITAIFALKAAVLVLGTTINLQFGGILLIIGAVVTGIAFLVQNLNKEAAANKEAVNKLKEQAAELTGKLKEEANKQYQDKLNSLNKIRDGILKAHDINIEAIKKEYGYAKDTSKSLIDLAYDVRDARISAIDDEIDKARQAHNERISQIEDEYKASLSATERVLQDQIDAIDAQTEAEDLSITRASEQKKLAELRAKMDSAITAEDIANTKADYEEYAADVARNELIRTRKDEKDALRARIQELRDETGIVVAELQKQRDFKTEVAKGDLQTIIDNWATEKTAAETKLGEDIGRYERDRDAKLATEKIKLDTTLQSLSTQTSTLAENHNLYMAQLDTQLKRFQDDNYAKLENAQSFVADLNKSLDGIKDVDYTVTRHEVVVYEGGGVGTIIPSTPSSREALAREIERPSMFDIPSYQHGGIVPGPLGQPQLAIVHGGEPIGENYVGNGGITINFTQPVFFDREDTMNKFVDMIRKGIQRQDRLRFGGAYSG